ncbi:MAG: hypothetical protein ABII79_11280 [bacterium]
MANFNQVLERLTIRDILADAGYHLRGNRLPCFLHDGKNPTSLAFTEHTFYCHSCGASGGLLDLIGYLHHCSREGACRYAHDLAGLPFEDNQADPPPESFRLRPPCRINPLLSNEEYLAAKNRLEWLTTIHKGLHIYLQIIRRNVQTGRIPLEDFYRREEVILYQLEELDSIVSEAKWELSETKRKARTYDNTEACCGG